MEVAAVSSTVAIPRLTSSFPANISTVSPQRNRALSLRSSPSPSSLSTNAAVSSFSSGAVGESYGIIKGKHDDALLFPDSVASPRTSRSSFAKIIPRATGANVQPKSLMGYLFKHRIMYLGTCLTPAFTKMLIKQFIYLGFQDNDKPIYLYINSTGTNKEQMKPSYEEEALTVHDFMIHSRAPVCTLCVGHAWGEAALILASGSKGHRAALPSASIMIKEAVGGFQGHTTDIERARQRLKAIRGDMVNLLAKHTRQTPERIQADYTRPKYFSPSEAIEYGLIDKILYTDKATEDRGAVTNLETANQI
ncbi:ATP-dependent Clp protease proteolytic subunit-related protein 4, chloroplastic [Linum perenne]